MKCEKCNNEYSSQYYFTTPTICNDCFKNLSAEEQKQEYEKIQAYQFADNEPYHYRIGFGPRLGAYFIDFVLFTIVFTVIVISSGVVEDYLANAISLFKSPAMMNDLIDAITPLSLISTFIYYSTEIFFAASPGKLVFGLRIANDDRQRASISTLAIRFMVKHIDLAMTFIVFISALRELSILTTLLWLVVVVGFFFVLAPKKQGFHDMISKTAVFKKDNVVDKVMTEDNKLA